MKTFITTHKGKEVDRETVSDCKTVEEYTNRKFGSVDPSKHDIKVSIAAPEKAPAAVKAPAPAAKAKTEADE